MDDDEESDEEEIDTCYLDPKSRFLLVLDSITLFSGLIILLYFPINLASKTNFCYNLRDSNAILFASIDIIYIMDLIINFYRDYYYYNDILIKKNILIFIHYCKTWLFLDLISAIPFYTIIKAKQSRCLDGNIYNDENIHNHGNHSKYYDTNLFNMHYLLTLLKVIKTLKILKTNIAVKI